MKTIKNNLNTNAYSECNNPNEYESLTDCQKEYLKNWIERRVKPYLIQNYNPSVTSYGIKRCFQSEGGFYITNGQMKGALLEAGILPREENRINWIFKIGKRFTIHNKKNR